MARAIGDGKADRGVLVCGTGIGISMAANRHAVLRAALVHDAFGARLARQHNDANVIVFGGRTIGSEVAKDCLAVFLATGVRGRAASGQGRQDEWSDPLNELGRQEL